MQDDWRIGPSLRLNPGTRYEVGPPFYDTQNRFTHFEFNLTPPALVLTSSS